MSDSDSKTTDAPTTETPGEGAEPTTTPAAKEPSWKQSLVGLSIAAALVVGVFIGGRLFAPADTKAAATPAAPTDSHAEHQHGAPPAGDKAEAQAEKPATVWTCSMDPQVRVGEPGSCPICGMDLIPAKQGGAAGAASVEMSEDARALAGIQTVEAKRRDVSVELNLVGKVAFDETAKARISARFGGRIERMYVDYEGTQVRKGDHLYQIYSPELWVAQEDLIQAERALSKLPAAASETLRDSIAQVVRAAKEKLKLWELRDWQIRRIAKTRRKTKRVTIYAPSSGVVLSKTADEGAYVKEGQPVYTIADLSRVWVQLDVYESDISWVKWGQSVTFEVAAYPGRRFKGKVAFIAPAMDVKTRTVQVRLTVDNTQSLLKPEMFVRAKLSVPVRKQAGAAAALAGKYVSPMHPEVVSDKPGKCTVCGMNLVPAEEHWLVGPSLRDTKEGQLPLVVPATAPLRSGKRAVVFVEMAGAETPTYILRDVVLGVRAGEWIVVEDGLMEGEHVVAQGAFKLDSALQLRGDRSLMSDDPKPGVDTTAGPADAVDPDVADVPAKLADSLTALRLAVDTKDVDAQALQTSAADVAKWAAKDEAYYILRGPAEHLKTLASGDEKERSSKAGRTAIRVAVDAMWKLAPSTLVLQKEAPLEDDERSRRFLSGLGDAATASSELSKAMAADDWAKSQEASKSLWASLKKLKKRKEARETVDPDVWSSAELMTKDADIAALRKTYRRFNDRFVPLVMLYSAKRESPIQRSYCPMVETDRGGFWLEPKGKLANPYFGASMLRCGTVGAVYE